MNPISNTAFYCCGIRMLDARQRRPVCGDTLARQFMDERGMEIFRRFGGESGPNASNVARHRYIDDFLRQQLARDARLQIALIGCGFDSRAFRLTGGTWFELDEPPLIAYKEERLPATRAPNPLRRIAIDFAADCLEEKLQALAPTVPTVFVIEGVTMYVPPEALRRTLEVLKSRFPGHRIIADLMTRSFINRYGRNVKRIIGQLGAQMIPGDSPALPFAQAGYRELSRAPIVGMIFRYRSLGFLHPLVSLLMPGGYSGYTIRVFQAAA
jgi:methyltransferase (TIGR00027 family)